MNQNEDWAEGAEGKSTNWKTMCLVICGAIVLIGTEVALIYVFFELTEWEKGMLGVIWACLIGWIFVWTYGKIDPQAAAFYQVSIQTVKISLLAIFGMSVVFLLSNLIKYHLLWLILYGLYMLLLFCAYRSALWGGHKGAFWGGLREFWNPKKTFGGGAFGDFANMTGVLSTIALGVSNDDKSWFWMGQFAAFLAALVGLSLVERSIQKASEELKASKEFLRCAGLNFSVGAFMFLSLICPSGAMEELLRNWWLKGFQIFVLALMFSIIAWKWQKFWKLRQFTNLFDAFFFFWIPLLVVGAIVTLVLFQIYIAPSWLWAIFSALAIFFWIILEFFNFLSPPVLPQAPDIIVKSVYKESVGVREIVLKWIWRIRCTGIIIGNVPIIILTILIAIDDSFKNKPFVGDIMIVTVIFLGLATFLGITMAAYKVAERHYRQDINDLFASLAQRGTYR